MTTAPTDDATCAMPVAMLALAAGVGFLITAGWMLPAAWGAAHDNNAQRWVRDRPRRVRWAH